MKPCRDAATPPRRRASLVGDPDEGGKRLSEGLDEQ
jgi:hypothetical protein